VLSILREKDLREYLALDLEAIAAVEDGFTRLARGEAFVPPVIGIEIPEHQGEVDVKTAYVRGWDSFAVKIASGFYDNPRLGLPTSSGMMVLVSARTGFPEAAFFDNGYLTQVRTGAAGAVAAKYLAPKSVRTVGVIGSGTQARFQVMGIHRVRSFERLLVFGIEPDGVEGYVAEMPGRLGVEVVKADDPETVVRQSEVVVTTTPAREPFLRAEWLHPCLHITAMGADAPEKQELQSDVMGRADLIVCDRKEQCLVRGELHHAVEAGKLPASVPVVELGDLTSGRLPGRQAEDQITICDLTGVGVQDTAIARLALLKAGSRGLKIEV
jgi:ornithine cyclodeaminase